MMSKMKAWLVCLRKVAETPIAACKMPRCNAAQQFIQGRRLRRGLNSNVMPNENHESLLISFIVDLSIGFNILVLVDLYG